MIISKFTTFAPTASLLLTFGSNGFMVFKKVNEQIIIEEQKFHQIKRKG